MALYHEQQGAKMIEIGGVPVPAHFGEVRAEYDAAVEGVGLHDRGYRGLIEITGGDRAAWLHNLTTNEIKNLQSGEGKYGFALNVKGRVLFDANVLVLPESLFVDIDRRWIGSAIEHLSRYIIMEDVQLADRSDDLMRLALVGPKAIDSAATWGSTNARAMSQLHHDTVRINGIECRMIRHDFAGPMGLELIVPADRAVELWEHLIETGAPVDISPLGLDALQVLRVEAGMPWSLEDIDGEVLPAETRQLERGVSLQKGCYLGQEIVERLRARGAPAKLLVGLIFDGGHSAAGTILQHEGQPAGRVTSSVDSFKLNCRIGLGYVKSALAEQGQQLIATTDAPCRICALPFS